MTCHINEHIAICQPHVDGWQRRFARCPSCRQRRLTLSEFQDWYGWRTTCLTCGCSWMDGEWRRGIKGAAQKAKQRVKDYLAANIPQGLDDFVRRLEAGEV